MPPLEKKEVKSEPERVKWKKRKNEGTGLKVLTPNKLLETSRPTLLAKIKAGNSSYKLEDEIGQILYLLYQQIKITKKSLQQFSQVIIIMEENMILTRYPKTFYFHFDWPKNVDANLKHESQFIIKSNE